MALLSWSNQYLIGHPVIDSEHQELFRLINAFHDHWLEQHESGEIARLLNQLVTYSQMHFRHEEDIMKEAGYPRLAEHQDVHEALVDTIFRLCEAYESKNIHLEMDTMRFVRSWLVDHIVQNDYGFRDFLARKKSVPATH
jgi:hemerythrin